LQHRRPVSPENDSTRRARPANHLLASLSASDFDLLGDKLERINLPRRAMLEDKAKDIKWVYFLDSGVASVVARVDKGREIEVGLVGREGMTGTVVVMGNHRSTNTTYIQVEGSGSRIDADDLRLAMRNSISLQMYFLHFAQAFMIQVANTALANGKAKIDERLARWLLMVHDRTEGNELRLTHEFVATMLGVRRAGVTTALQHLASRKLIEVKRSHILVRRRAGLQNIADGIYGLPEREYERLIGWKPLHG
jgi:CRP-like cAMP-binding protein